MSTSYRRILIVANPIAGSGRARAQAEELARELRRFSGQVELFFTAARGDATQHTRARRGELDLAVAVGGDGTVREVLEGLGDGSVPLAVLPMGTANVMSLDLGLPRNAAGTARMIANAHTTQVDVARTSGGMLSFLVTGAGLDAQIVHALEELRNGPITKFTWFRAGVRALLRDDAPRLVVALDGRELRGEHCLVLFSNIVHYGGHRVLARDRVLDDGEWELYLFPARMKPLALLYGLRALAFGLPGGPVKRVRGKKLEVRSASPVPYHVDGDAAGTTPFTIEVEAVQRRLVIP
jgi:diacylglycerol kinase family enzyme